MNAITKLLLIRLAVGGLLGLFYVLFLPIANAYQIVLCVSMGISVAVFTGLTNHFLLYSKLNTLPLLIVFSMRVLLFTIVITLALLFAIGVLDIFDQLLFHRETSLLSAYYATVGWLFHNHYWLLLVASFAFLIVGQLFAVSAGLLGKKILFNYFMGKYYHPKQEERIFLFVDLKSSTTIAEKLGNFDFHAFLKSYFADIAKPIAISGGDIYEYAGDEVIVTWPKNEKHSAQKCLSCFNLMKQAIAKRSDFYRQTYGFVPTFRGGGHVGAVLVGEIGVYRRKIIYAGDVLNTCARIIAEGNKRNQECVISENLYRLLQPYFVDDQFEFLDKALFKGKQTEVAIYAVNQ
jgi:adenylate cyclase